MNYQILEYKLKILFILFMFLLLTSCSETINNKLIIDKININLNYNISSIKDEVVGVSLFSEYGRPDIINSNTVIGAHSGIGPNALFNELNQLDIGDTISIIYNNYLYEYIIIEKINTNKKNIDILNNRDYSIITLITCDLNNRDNRVAVIGKLFSNID